FQVIISGRFWVIAEATRRATITRCWAKSPRNSARRTRPAFGRAKRFRGCIREVTHQSECGDQRLHAHERHTRNTVVFAFPIGLRNCDLAERSSRVRSQAKAEANNANLRRNSYGALSD